MIKFRDLYNAIKNTEIAYERMGVDIEAAICGMSKCVLTSEQQNLLESYMELANIDVDFCELDFQSIIERIDECFNCVTDEFTGLLPPPLPEPEQTETSCNGTLVVPIEHIKRFRIYERTYTHNSIPSAVQVYVVTKGSLPYTFKPSVPEQYTSHEKYHVSWNTQRNSLRIRLTHDQNENLSPAEGSYNICMIVAEIDDQFQGYYGYNEVKACIAMQMTKNVEWAIGFGLDKAVDGSASTYTKTKNTPKEVICEFMFSV